MAGDVIVAKTEGCLRILASLGGPPAGLQDASWAEEQQMRLDLWASKLGVFANERLSITYRLRKNLAVSQAIQQILHAVLLNLQSINAQSKPDEDDEQVAPRSYAFVGTDVAAGSDENDESDQKASFEWISALSEDNTSSSSSSSSSGSSDASENVVNTRDTILLKTNVEENIGDLLRLASLIRQQSTSRTLQGGETYEPTSIDDQSSSVSDDRDVSSGGKTSSVKRNKKQVPFSARFQTYVEYVLMRELGPQRYSEPQSEFVRGRLLRTMMTRWRRMCYRSARGRRFAEVIVEAEKDQPPLVQMRTPKKQTELYPVPKSEKRKPTVPTATPEKPSMPKSSLDVATTLPSEFNFSGLRQLKSHSEKSASRIGEGDLNLPIIPKAKHLRDGYMYDCSYCGVLPTTKKPLDRRTWKAHLWRDIAPYICLCEDCDSAESGFTSVHAWLEHMKVTHWKPWFVCSQCPGPQGQCQNEAELQNHIHHVHEEDLEAQELAMVARFSRRDFCLDRCLICGLKQGISDGAQELPVNSSERQNNINRCMASHLESLALSSLPYHFGSKDEANSDTVQISDRYVNVEHSITGSPVDRQDITDSKHIGNLHDLKNNPEVHHGKTLRDTVDTWNQTCESTSVLVDEPMQTAETDEAPVAALGADHLDMLSGTASFASVHKGEGRMEEAKEQEVQVVEAMSEAPGASHPETLSSIANLASTYTKQGRWNEVEQLGMKVMDSIKGDGDLGPDDVIALLSNILQAASLTGNAELVKLLLERGARTNAEGGFEYSALQAASTQGHIEIVKLLLDRGAEVDEDRIGGSALQAASTHGHAKVVALLLDHGADVNAEGRSSHSNALQDASAAGYAKVVRLLVDRGANINAEGGYYGNALRAASAGGHAEVVRLLHAYGAIEWREEV